MPIRDFFPCLNKPKEPEKQDLTSDIEDNESVPTDGMILYTPPVPFFDSPFSKTSVKKRHRVKKAFLKQNFRFVSTKRHPWNIW